MPILRAYIDTSVFGGCFDFEFEEASRKLFEQARAGLFALHVSDLVAAECEFAPADVRQRLNAELAGLTVLPLGEEAERLAERYVKSGVITAKWMTDALHVAVATVGGCDAIISWNFKHIVHEQKIGGYNGVNLLEGYRQLAIYSPLEVIRYED